MPTYLRRTLYVVLGLVGFVLLLVIGVVVALQFPSTQDYVARKAANYLQDKIGTEVRIGKFRTDFKHALNLDGVYVEDQKGTRCCRLVTSASTLTFGRLPSRK
ncbi:hypothetical protein [Hymenobacter volaticus]|uniref:AsmA family protein n=1 Tax=Hymenobacter volaticus TaxID=2932254 RepID=A0ABY4G670_9BACT|nr:hypothetical protein [Hymenobacter volaticus]UOQ66383.1 hypothetical protein MUN86_00160 [Hymenobacter volaticus]